MSYEELSMAVNLIFMLMCMGIILPIIIPEDPESNMTRDVLITLCMAGAALMCGYVYSFN